MEILQSLGIAPKEFFTDLIGFIILILLFWRYGMGPIMGVLDQRQQQIKDTYDQLDADRAAMDRTRQEYERRLVAIEEQAREKIQEAVKEAQDLRASMIADAQKQAETLVEAGRAELERERARTFVELRREIADIAIQAATKVIGQAMDDARQRTLVDEFIASVASQPVRTRAAGPAGAAASNGSGAS